WLLKPGSYAGRDRRDCQGEGAGRADHDVSGLVEKPGLSPGQSLERLTHFVVVAFARAGKNEAENKQAILLRGPIVSNASDIHADAVALFQRLPEPQLAPASSRLYVTTLQRMMAEDVVEPLRAGDARDTYNV